MAKKKKALEPEFKLAFLRPGVYRHYAGKLYCVIATVRHTETDEDLVLYFPLYAHKNGGRVMQVRPLSMWFDVMNAWKGIGKIKGKEIVTRFTFVDDTLPPGIKQ